MVRIFNGIHHASPEPNSMKDVEDELLIRGVRNLKASVEVSLDLIGQYK